MIPTQLQNIYFRFIKIANNKIAIEKEWQSINNYSHEGFKYTPYGVVCGYGNLIFIDFDSKEAQEHYLPALPETFTVKTAGKGLYHLYYITDKPETKRINGENGQRLVDIQGKGTYVVGAGSIIGERIYTIEKDIDIARISHKQLKEVFADRWKFHDAQIKLDVKSLIGVEKGQRNEIAFKKFCSLLSSGHDKKDAWNIVSYWNSKNNPPLNEDELLTCFSSALRYDYSNAPKMWVYNNLIKKQDELELISVKEAIEKGIPQIEYVITPFLRKGGLTIIGGEPGAKKTLLAMMASIDIAKGTPLFNKFECQKLKVCYMDFENGYAVMLNRYNALLMSNFSGEGNPMADMENVALSVFNDLKIDLPEHKAKIAQIIEKTGADVFIIDSLVRCMEGEEDKATDIRRVFDILKEFMADGKSFIILHHTRKDNNAGMMGLRGSSDLSGMAEIVLMLKPSGEKNRFTNVTLAKHRHLGIEATEDWSFEVVPLFGEGSNMLKLAYHERDPERQTKLEQCMEDALEWLSTLNKENPFRTGAIEQELKQQGHRKTTIFDTLEELKKGKKIKKNGHGKWECV